MSFCQVNFVSTGFHVKLIHCEDENIKITTPDDIMYAEYILKKRRSANK
ncbi:MAG: 2-C-methyl-D-erythritol 4-phosphate cytidylyltransferase [Clostridia bacterium]|nr:2-C-methyl-D-erythritol 4-phosphate cytidylyltransferase [Clostridia bacterium]